MPLSSMAQRIDLTRALTLRRTLVGLLLVTILAFAATFVWAINSYSDFTIRTHAAMQSRMIADTVRHRLQSDHERPALELVRNVASLPEVHEALRSPDARKLERLLAQSFNQGLVSGGTVDLVALVAFDGDWQEITSAASEQGRRTIESLVKELSQRRGADRRRIFARYMLDNQGEPLYVLVHPVGTVIVAGYIAAVMRPLSSLSGLATTLGTEVVATTAGGKMLFEERTGPGPGASDITDVPVQGSDGQTLFHLQLALDNSAFRDEARRLRLIGYVALAATAAGVSLVGMLLLRGVVFRRIELTSKALRAIVEARPSFVMPPGGPDEIGRMSRDLARVVDYVREALTLRELMAAKNEALQREVVERERAESDAHRAQTEAERANRAKSEFLATMSHELRTPLNAILVFSQLIGNQMLGPIHAEYLEFAKDIHGAGHHLLIVFNDILDMACIEAGRITLRENAVSLTAVVEACARMVEPKATDGGVVIDIAEHRDVPMIFGDQARLRQIVLNLFANAVKFTPAGGKVAIAISWDPREGFVLTIRDTGIGMSEDEIAMALQPFRQADSSLARKYEGAGLGLPIAKSLIELHGGRLIIVSAPTAGTTVHVLFPADRVFAQRSITSQPAELVINLESAGTNQTIERTAAT
jgi:signal transduction histidine kinase